MFLRLAIFALLAGLQTCFAFPAKVIAITDGDTIKVLDSENQLIKIRLAGIDAPESKQAFGQKSKQYMSSLCFGVQAEITPKTIDRYGRTVANVNCKGKDAGTEMVSAGMAWVYDKYAKGFEQLYPLQDKAKAERLGLWADSEPTPPWVWRHRKH